MNEQKPTKPTRDSKTTRQPGDDDHASDSKVDIKGPSALPSPDQDDRASKKAK